VEEDKTTFLTPNAKGDGKENPRSTPTNMSCTSDKVLTAKEKPYEKKKAMRRRRAEEQMKRKGVDLEKYKADRRLKEERRKRTLESYLQADDTQNEWAHKLEIRLLQHGTPEFEQTIEESFNVYQKYQRIIHNDHECSRRGYENFLVSSPLTTFEDGIQPPLGSYHQQYLLDGRIIAVGIVDILPRCLSSKYFYYDPAFKFLSLGTYSALREIAFTQKLMKDRPALRYYYMGYYLQNCPKMRYKGKFRPSDLLCDRTFNWVPLDECVKKIVANDGKYTVFCPEEPAPEEIPADEVKCMTKDAVLSFREYKLINPSAQNLEPRISEYAKYAGPLAQRMALFL
jgi:arginine-tRNA-protein transferase